jgi:hypothetical protein
MLKSEELGGKIDSLEKKLKSSDRRMSLKRQKYNFKWKGFFQIVSDFYST